MTKDSTTIIDSTFFEKKVGMYMIHEFKITDHALLKIELNVYKVATKYREFIGTLINSRLIISLHY